MKTLFTLISLFLIDSHAANNAFSKIKPNEPQCYGREYSEEHLRDQPQQRVKKIQAKLETYPAQNGSVKSNIMRVEVTLKGKENEYTNYRAFFICDEEKDLCSIECDGGNAQVRISDGGNLFIINQGFRVNGCEGYEDDSKDVRLSPLPGADDIFEMVPLPRAYCQISE